MFNRGSANQIAECVNIRQALSLISYDSWLLLDLDNTVMTTVTELGSDQWFVSLFNVCSDAILIYHAIQHFIRTAPVEQDIVWMIERLQAIGVPVLAITARDACLAATTERQLDEIGIDFSRNPPLVDTPHLLPSVVYRKGIVYCSGQDKGVCFREFLQKTAHHPGHIVMLDDKQKHLDHVARVAKDMKIPFHGLRYGHLDERVKRLDMEMAKNELALVSAHLPEEVQASIDRHQLLGNADPYAVTECRAHLFYFKQSAQGKACAASLVGRMSGQMDSSQVAHLSPG